MNDLVEMGLKPLFQTIFGLAYILFATFATNDTVEQVVDVAAHVVSRPILLPCYRCPDMALVVNEWAVPVP